MIQEFCSKTIASAQMSRTYALTVTSPTCDLAQFDYISQILCPHTSYQVLPSSPVIVYDVEQLLARILPLTQHKLLDIALPVFYRGSTAPEGVYFGRYLIYNQILIGVKLSCSTNKQQTYSNSQIKKWPINKISHYKVPNSILNYYKTNNINPKNYRQKIVIGDIFLRVGNIKIGLPFESQCKDIDQVLRSYQIMGCQIVSMICDIPRQSHYENNLNFTTGKNPSSTESSLKRFSRSGDKVIMYSGPRMATQHGLFLTNSFIIHPQLPERSMEPLFFNFGSSFTLLCEITNKMKKSSEKILQTKGKYQLSISKNLNSVGNKIHPGKINKLFVAGIKPSLRQRDTFCKQNGNLLVKMKIWYWFNKLNNATNFITSIPLGQKMENVVNELILLSQFLNAKLSDFLTIYKSRPTYVPTSQETALGLFIYCNLEDVMKNLLQSQYCVYTDDQNEHKQLVRLSQKYQNIYIHFNALILQAKSNKMVNARHRLLEEFAEKIIANRIFGFEKILTLAKEQELLRDQKREVVSILKFKLRSDVRQHPFFQFISKNSLDYLENIMGEAELKMMSKEMQTEQQNYMIIEQEQEEAMYQKLEKQERQFFKKYKESKSQHAQIKKKQAYVCHKCGCAEQKEYIYKCISCKSQVCFFCIDMLLLHNKAKQKKQFMQCIVCKKLCYCASCKSKNRPNGERKQNQNSSNSISVTAPIAKTSLLQQMVQQLKNEELKKQDQHCSRCLIMDRKYRGIKIECQNCDTKMCLNCARNQISNGFNFEKKWLCVKCRPEQPKPIQVRHQNQERMIDQNQNEQHTPYAEISPIEEFSAKKSIPNGKPKSRSRSVSKSPPRNHKKVDKTPQQNKERSFSRSVSPKKDKRNHENNRYDKRKVSPSRSASVEKKSRPQNKKPQTRQRSLSNSASPVRKQNKKSPSRSPSPKKNNHSKVQRNKSRSRSNSPKQARNREDKNKLQNQTRKRSLSNSASPVRNNPKKDSRSKSKSPPRKKKSVSRSRSRSIERQDKQPQKPLWNNRNQNNNRGNQYNRGGYNNRGNRGGYNRGGNNNNGDRNNHNDRNYNNNNDRSNINGNYNNGGGRNYNNNNGQRRQYNNNRGRGQFNNRDNNERENNGNNYNNYSRNNNHEEQNNGELLRINKESIVQQNECDY